MLLFKWDYEMILENKKSFLLNVIYSIISKAKKDELEVMIQ